MTREVLSTRESVEATIQANTSAQMSFVLAAAALENAAAEIERLADKVPQHEERSNR